MILTSRSKGFAVTEAVIFDLQGTLVDVTSVRHLVERDEPDFDSFHVETGTCPANQWVVDEAKKAHVDGKVVIVMTGMNEKFRGLMVSWLTRHEVPFDLLQMRENKDYRKDFVVKREMLKDVNLRGFTVTHAWDDNPQIIDLWRHKNIPVTVVPGWVGRAR
jgi:hypothetical protein